MTLTSQKYERYIIYAYDDRIEVHGSLALKEIMVFMSIFSEMGFDRIETTENNCLKIMRGKANENA